jgi:hypothetical protein
LSIEVKISPTKKVVVYGVDVRSPENIAWCAATYGINRLFWIDGYLLCAEVHEKSFEHEIKEREFPITQVCYAKFPDYTRLMGVDKRLQIPIVNASDMKIFQMLILKILQHEKKPRGKHKKIKRAQMSS